MFDRTAALMRNIKLVASFLSPFALGALIALGNVRP